MNNILSYISFMLMFFIIFNIPISEFSYRRDIFINKYLKGDINKEYKEPLVETKTQVENQRFKNIESLDLRDINNENLITRYNKMKKSIIQLRIIITYVCDFLEKIKNLVLWKDPQRTFFFLIFIFIFYVFASKLPIRIFVILGGLKILDFSLIYINIIIVLDKFYCGEQFYKLKNVHNKLIASKVIRYIMEKKFPEYFLQFDEDKEWQKNSFFNSFNEKVNKMK